METVAALVVNAVTIINKAMVVVKVRGGHSIGDMDDIGAALPP